MEPHRLLATMWPFEIRRNFSRLRSLYGQSELFQRNFTPQNFANVARQVRSFIHSTAFSGLFDSPPTPPNSKDPGDLDIPIPENLRYAIPLEVDLFDLESMAVDHRKITFPEIVRPDQDHRNQSPVFGDEMMRKLFYHKSLRDRLNVKYDSSTAFLDPETHISESEVQFVSNDIVSPLFPDGTPLGTPGKGGFSDILGTRFLDIHVEFQELFPLKIILNGKTQEINNNILSSRLIFRLPTSLEILPEFISRLPAFFANFEICPLSPPFNEFNTEETLDFLEEPCKMISENLVDTLPEFREFHPTELQTILEQLKQHQKRWIVADIRDPRLEMIPE